MSLSLVSLIICAFLLIGAAWYIRILRKQRLCLRACWLDMSDAMIRQCDRSLEVASEAFGVAEVPFAILEGRDRWSELVDMHLRDMRREGMLPPSLLEVDLYRLGTV